MAFENNLIAVVKNIRLRNYNNLFQTKFNKDIKSLRNSNKTVTFADKTTNLYRLTKEENNKLLQNKEGRRRDKRQNQLGRQVDFKVETRCCEKIAY